MSSFLEFLNVSFATKETRILENISFSLKKGEIVTIIGPNGAGKTTLAKLLAGILTPSSGEIKKDKHMRMSYMPQKITVNPFLPMSVEAFLEGVPSKLSKKRLQELSGGEWQRVLLERCLTRKPDLLILDEPTQGVDLFGEEEIYTKLTDLRDQTGVSIVMISHDLHFVLKASDQVLCLNKHICCAGTPVDVYQSDEYKKLFPNVAFYPHHHDHFHHG